jgi:hypothetical protein
MSKCWETLPNAVYDDEEEHEPEELKIKTEDDIIKYYLDETVDKQLVYDAVEKFNVHMVIDDYKDKLQSLAYECFETFIKDEAPTHIFDTGLYNNRTCNFIDFVYNYSTKGQNLNIILQIQDEYDKKIELERKIEEEKKAKQNEMIIN